MTFATASPSCAHCLYNKYVTLHSSIDILERDLPPPRINHPPQSLYPSLPPHHPDYNLINAFCQRVFQRLNKKQIDGCVQYSRDDD
uniref:ORF82a n=2 Tax=Cydia pomonella granulosis virus TaxID=28289 RepID=A0A097P1J1_GVCP|nr:ORF82a [Cydia pomonella granulovirus]AIU36864.1 ORF82a [Cydia pomonella granulovirus]AIU37007.1 ORF82b [Cydia pomonella granulovirus]AIU37149.1 ORF82b [Cydia pomonella granulovirus]AIU37288.1 ORF82b [Cydia pomonella granulovirus]